MFLIPSFMLFSQDYNINYDISSTFAYQRENDDFLLYDSDEDWIDYSYLLTGQISFSGGTFGHSQFDIDLDLQTIFNNGSDTNISFDQLYFKIPLGTFIYFTIGKIKENFGEATFTNFSNIISPKFLSLNGITRQAPELMKIDWLTTDFLTLGLFSWFSDIKKWKDMNTGVDADLNLGPFSVSLYGYWEKFDNISVGLNSSVVYNIFKVYLESIIKQNTGQYYFTKDESGVYTAKQKENDLFYDIASGFTISISMFSFGFEYWFRNEGVTDAENSSFKDAVKQNPQNLVYYTQNYYGKNYLGISINCSKFIIDKLNFSFENLYSIERTGNELNTSLSYIINDNAALRIGGSFSYGNKESEYILLNKERFNIFSSILFSF